MKQREEEQALLSRFQKERENVEISVKEEGENEWEKRLQNITDKLDKQYNKKKGNDYEQVAISTLKNLSFSIMSVL